MLRVSKNENWFSKFISDLVEHKTNECCTRPQGIVTICCLQQEGPEHRELRSSSVREGKFDFVIVHGAGRDGSSE